MPERDPNQLAAEVRAYLLKQKCSQEHHDALAALRELVGLVGTLRREISTLTDESVAQQQLVGTLQQERDEAFSHEDDLMRERDNYESMWRMQRDRAEAAEAALATTRQALTLVRDWVRDGKGTESEAAEAMDAALAADTGGDTEGNNDLSK